MILSSQTIHELCHPTYILGRTQPQPLITPFHFRTVVNGMTYGLSAAGYDIRVAEDVEIGPFMQLASSIEKFSMPSDVMGMVKDKSSLARRGVAVQNTVIEPGWRGHLTLELTNHAGGYMRIPAGSPIAQIVFMRLDHPSQHPYDGKYQDQKAGPQPAIMEDQ